MAKTVVSVRVDPRTLERIDETAKALGIPRGQLISESLDAAYGTPFGPLEIARAIAENRTSKIHGFISGLEQETYEQMEQLTEEQRAKAREALAQVSE